MKPLLARALRSVSPEVRLAFELSHKALQAAGVPHVLVGGLAVNAHGHHYSTRDVDYLVDPEAAFEGTVVLNHKRGVPFAVQGVAIDYVTAKDDFPEAVKAAMCLALSSADGSPDGAVVSASLLVWMKLYAGRTKDLAAVEGLLEVGLDAPVVRAFLKDAGDPRVMELFERCVLAQNPALKR